MKISIITAHPSMIYPFCNESIIKRAREKKLVQLNIINLRDFTHDAHKTIDDRPYGGGAGMVLMAEPIIAAIESAKFKNLNSKVILTSPRGKVYNQQLAQEYVKLDHIIIIAGHYEGVDERVTKYINDEVSIGDFVMTGGEIAASAIIDSIVRLIPGVLKKEEATRNESFSQVPLKDLIEVVGLTPELSELRNKGATQVLLLEYPHYTRPKILTENITQRAVPDVLISGDHHEITVWRLRQAYEITIKRRPDLLKQIV